MTIEALKQKAGYTPIELEICNKFRTKYCLKIYEMYLCYYSLPNKEGKGVGKISKSQEYLIWLASKREISRTPNPLCSNR